MAKVYPRSAPRPSFPLGNDEFETIAKVFRRPLTEPQRFEIAEIWTDWLSEFGMCRGAPSHGEVKDKLQKIQTASRRLFEVVETSVTGGKSKNQQVKTWSRRLRDALEASMQGPRGLNNSIPGDGVVDQLVQAGVELVVLDRLVLATNLLLSPPSVESRIPPPSAF